MRRLHWLWQASHKASGDKNHKTAHAVAQAGSVTHGAKATAPASVNTTKPAWVRSMAPRRVLLPACTLAAVVHSSKPLLLMARRYSERQTASTANILWRSNCMHCHTPNASTRAKSTPAQA